MTPRAPSLHRSRPSLGSAASAHPWASAPALRRALVALAAGLALAGCPAAPQPQPSTQPVKPRASVAAVSEPSPTPQRFLTFEVVVKAPAGGGNGAATPWEPVSGAEVSVQLAATRRPIADVAPARTDAQGRVNFSLKPPGAPLLILAKVGAVTLRRVYPVVNGDRAVVDPSTTLVAVFFDKLEVGKNDAMKRIDAPRLESLAVKVRSKLEADAAGIDLSDEAKINAAYEAMLAADPQLETQTYAALGRSQLGGKSTAGP